MSSKRHSRCYPYSGQTLNNQCLTTLSIKKTKLETPLESPHYPVTEWDHMSPLLQSRLLELRQVVCDVFEWDDIMLCLGGSQVSGKSASNHPDIDAVYYNPNIYKISPRDMQKYYVEVAKRLSFRFDGGPSRQPVQPRGIPGSRGSYVRVLWPDKNPTFHENSTKESKKSVPLNPDLKYPMTNFETQASDELKRCVQQFKVHVEEVFEVKDPLLYLRGSQVHGKSQSGRPDVDMAFHHADINKLSPEERQSKNREVVRRCDFALDVDHVNRPFPLDRQYLGRSSLVPINIQQ